MKKIIIAFVLLLLAFSSTLKAQEQKITVAVAANMQYAFNELKAEFEKLYKIHVDVVVGASGNLTQQIMRGAPFDIFVSADTSYPHTIFEKNFAAEKPKVYAQGVLVLWTTRNDIALQQNLQFLLSEKIKRIAIANPKTAPYGTAAESILKKYNVYNKVEKKIVTGENITQTSQYIATQNADVGFTAKAIVLSKEMEGKGKWIELNQADYPRILQSAVLLKQSLKNNALSSEKFYNFLYSAKAKSIYKKYGYIVI